MKKEMVKLIAILCLLAMILGLTACAAQNTPADSPSASPEQTDSAPPTAEAPAEVNTEKTDETLVVALTAEPKTMYPNTPVSNTSAYSIFRVLYNRLMEIDPYTNELLPSVAESWSWDDPLHLRVKVRKGVTAADGSELTAEDVLYTFTTAQENSATISNYIDLNETKVEDTYTIVIGLSREDGGFPYLLADNDWGIISKSATEACGGFDATVTYPGNGSGKYRFSEWKTGEYITVERNESYWDESYTGYYKYIKYVFITDPSARMLAAQSGDVDIATAIGIAQAQSISDAENVKVITIGAGAISNLIVNCSQAPFGDQRVREAMRYLIDAETINQSMNMGASKIQSPWLSAKNEYYYDVLPEGGYDPLPREEAIAEAKALLNDAGYPDGVSFEATIMASQEALFTFLQSMLSEGGMEMKITIADPGVWAGTMMDGSWMMADLAVLGSLRGQAMLAVLDPETTYMFGNIHYSENNFGDTVTAARVAQEPAEAKAAYQALQQQLWDDCLVLFSYEQFYAVVMSGDIEGVFCAIRSMVYDVSEVRPAV